MNSKPAVDKNSVVYRENLVKGARTNLLVAVLFTVLNVVMLLARTNRYFLFSMTLPYYLTFFGYMFDFFRVSTYTYTGLVLAVIPVLVALLCWFMSKKDNRWLWGGTAVFALDTVAMLAMIIWSGDISGAVIDVIFHGWVLFTLIRGLIAVNSLRKPVPVMPWEAPVEFTQNREGAEEPQTCEDCTANYAE
jgi:hypothetical protein